MAASSAAAGAVGVSMVAVTCGATAIAALLLSQHETKEARLAEALQLLAQKEEQLQQAFRERSRLSDQLAAEREARLHVERSASRANVSTAPAGGQVSDAPKPLALDPRLLGLMPAHPPSSKSSHALETRESSSEGSNIVRDSTSGASGSEAVSTPPQTDSQHSASAELVKLRQADVEGVVQFLHVSVSACIRWACIRWASSVFVALELTRIALRTLAVYSDTTCPSTRQYSDSKMSEAMISVMCSSQINMVSRQSKSLDG